MRARYLTNKYKINIIIAYLHNNYNDNRSKYNNINISKRFEDFEF